MSVGVHELVEDEISRTSDPPPASPDAQDDTVRSLLGVHMPGVDLLRGAAIVMVLVYHGFAFSAPFLAWHNPLAHALFDLTGLGWTGVNLFFVLSGFLITGNLSDSQGKPNFYSRFYLRRALRILPVYYAVLLLLWLLHLATWNYLVVCIFFLANMPGALLPRGGWRGYGPLWSLAVEEQFYLIWPWLSRRLRDRGLAMLCLVLMVACPVLRGLALRGTIHLGDVFSKTWSIGDNLAIGALLALVLRRSRMRRQTVVRAAAVLALVAATGLVLLAVNGVPIKESALGGSLGFSLIECLWAGVLVLFLDRYRGARRPGKLTWLVFFGDISYGLYLLHMMCEKLFDRWVRHGAAPTTGEELWVRFLVTNAIAIGLATLSKRYFENPVLQLKQRINAAR